MRQFSLGRAFRFFGIGGLSTAIYWAALLVLSGPLRINPTFASMTAYGLGFAASYLGHRNFTYRSRALIGLELARFLVVQGLSFTLGNLVFHIAVAGFGLPVVIGGALLTAVSICVSFLAFEAWVFRRKN